MDDGAELFDEGGDTGGTAGAHEVAHPLDVASPRPRTALAADDGPVKHEPDFSAFLTFKVWPGVFGEPAAAEVQSFEQGFKGGEADGRDFHQVGEADGTGAVFYADA